MIELIFRFKSLDNAKSFMTGLGKKCTEAIESTTLATETQPIEPPATVAAPTIAPTVAPPPVNAPAVAAPPAAQPAGGFSIPAAVPPAGLDALLGGMSAAQLPPKPTVAAPMPAAPPPAPATPAAATQQDVLKAFVTLAQNPQHGPTSVRAVLDKLGAPDVARIPAAQYGAAVQAVSDRLAGRA